MELVPESATPRLWRVTPTVTAFTGYWAEAFASLYPDVSGASGKHHR